MQKEIVTIALDNKQVSTLKNRYADFAQKNSNEYVIFFAKINDLTVTVFKGKKSDVFKTTFVGSNALKMAKEFDENATICKTKTKITKSHWCVFIDQIGSDEVGTGDFFGPIIVVSAFVKKNQIERLKELGVDDSKRLKDEDIMRLGKILIKEVEYSQLALTNEKYNELIDKKLNMNEIKAKMHNQVLLNLRKKHKNTNVFIDEFAPQQTYFSYLDDVDEIVKDITFKTKGESYFPSVAVASIIARYSFLQRLDIIAKRYSYEKIPFGASLKVDRFAKEFVKKHGKNELLKVVKKNFANLDKVLI